MAEPIRLTAAQLADRPVADEWLVTNGLGGCGYAPGDDPGGEASLGAITGSL